MEKLEQKGGEQSYCSAQRLGKRVSKCKQGSSGPRPNSGW